MRSSHCSTYLCLLAVVPLACGGATQPGTPTAGQTSTVPEAQPIAPDAPLPTQKETVLHLPTITLSLNKAVLLDDENGTEVALRSYTMEEIEAAPMDAESYPSGSGVVIGVEFAGRAMEFSDLSDGYDSHTVKWAPNHRITLLDHDASANTAVFTIEHVTDDVAETLYSSARFETKKTIQLSGTHTAVFEYHSHKRTYPGQTSPLIVGMSYSLGAGHTQSQSYNIFPKEGRAGWRWRNYQFTLGDYDYGSYMNLTVETLKMTPVNVQSTP